MSDDLDIIDREIKKLKEMENLDWTDTKRLEILIKMKRLLLNQPTEIIQEDYNYTDREVLSVIKKGKKADGKKTPKKATPRVKKSS